MTNKLGIKSNYWLPRKLSEGNCANRERICRQLIDMHDVNNFLLRVVTVDERDLGLWVHILDRAYHNRSWFGHGDNPTTSVKERQCNNAGGNYLENLNDSD